MLQRQKTKTQTRNGGGGGGNDGPPGYGKVTQNTQATQGAHHGRADSNTGLLKNPAERDAWLDSELLTHELEGNFQAKGNFGSSFLGGAGADMNSSQLQIKGGRDASSKLPMGAVSGTGGGGIKAMRPPSAQKQNSLRNNKVAPMNIPAQANMRGAGGEMDYEMEMENIMNEYDHQRSYQPQNLQPLNNMGSGNLVVPKGMGSGTNTNSSSSPNGGFKNMLRPPNQQQFNQMAAYQMGMINMNGPNFRGSPVNQFSGMQTLNPTSNMDITNPMLENIEQSFAQSRSNIASMIQQYGQDADPLPDVEDILEEEDNIKEASQFRSRDIIMRQRSGHQQSKYRTLTTMIRDPDADLLENETEAQIIKIKRFCRRICKCCEKKQQLDDSFNYTTGESDVDCQEMFLAMDEEEQQNRVLELWQRTLAKARGAVKVIEIFGDLNRRIYLYGSDKKHDYLYEQDKLKPLPFILLPQSRVKNFWNFVMMLLVIYTGTYIPYKTAFVEDTPTLQANIELGIDMLFIIDLIVNFISAYEDSEKNIEFRFRKIAFKYITGWFILDMVSCIPFQFLDFGSSSDNGDFEVAYVDTSETDLTASNSTLRFLEAQFPFGGAAFRILQSTTTKNTKTNDSLKYSKLLKLTRLPRLYKLLRILRLFKMMRLLKYNRNIKRLFDQLKLNPGYMKMITVSVTVMFLVHLVSCFYFMVASFTDFDPDSWVVRKGLIDSPNFTQYITAMYWAFQTLTTVGYGDVQGATTLERVYCLVWMIFGVAFYSFTIGNLQSIISTIDVKASELSAKLNTLTGFAKRTKLPDNIVLKIKRFLENNNANSIALSDSRQMLNELPSTLRAEVVKQTYADIIEKVKFFNKKDSDFLWAFLPALKPMKVYSKDILYSQGDHPEEVFFIQKGRVKLCYDITEGEGQMPINVPFNMYVEGSYFGDLEILIKRYRKLGRDGTAIVDSECHLLVIGSKELKGILKYFKEIEEQMIHTAKKRRVHHKKQIQEAKKRYHEKKVKALKNAQIFTNKNALNQFSNWKKKSKKADNFIKRAKASRKKLEMIASHKNGMVQSDDEDDNQEGQPQIQAAQEGTISIGRLSKKHKSGFNQGEEQNGRELKKKDSVSDYDDDEDDEEDDEEDSDGEDTTKKKKQQQQQTQQEQARESNKSQQENKSLQNISQTSAKPSLNLNINVSSMEPLKVNPVISALAENKEQSARDSLDASNNLLKLKTNKYAPQEPVTMMDLIQITSATASPNIDKLKQTSQFKKEQPQKQEAAEDQAALKQQPQSQPPKGQTGAAHAKEQEKKVRKSEKEARRSSKEKRKKEKNKQRRSSEEKYPKDGFKHLKREQEKLERKAKEGEEGEEQQPKSTYDHEKQMRLFNDTMSALALNAYEIQEVNEKISLQLQFRNSKLDRMETMSRSIENSLTNMETMISQIMESI